MCERCSARQDQDNQIGNLYGFCVQVYHPFYNEDGWICCGCHTWNRLDAKECRRDKCKHPRCKEA